jgi:uncharacterized protein (TIGR02246 family)
MRRSLLSLAALAMVIATPTLAADQDARRTAESVISKFDAAYNRHDAAALAALFTNDAAFLPAGRMQPQQGSLVTGRQNIGAFFQGLFPNFANSRERVVEARSIGDSGIWYISDVQLSGQVQVQGQNRPIQMEFQAAIVLVRDGDQWRISLATANPTAPERPNAATSQAPYASAPVRAR